MLQMQNLNRSGGNLSVLVSCDTRQVTKFRIHAAQKSKHRGNVNAEPIGDHRVAIPPSQGSHNLLLPAG